jgi:hypothetical protein
MSQAHLPRGCLRCFSAHGVMFKCEVSRQADTAVATAQGAGAQAGARAGVRRRRQRRSRRHAMMLTDFLLTRLAPGHSVARVVGRSEFRFGAMASRRSGWVGLVAQGGRGGQRRTGGRRPYDDTCHHMKLFSLVSTGALPNAFARGFLQAPEMVAKGRGHRRLPSTQF